MPLLVSILAFAATSLTLTPLRLTLLEYFLSFSYTGRFFLYVLFAWLIFSGAFRDFSQKIIRAFLIAGISFTVLGLLQFIFFPNLDFLTVAGWDPHYFRTVSTFLDPNFAGAFLVLTLIIISHLTCGLIAQRGRHILAPRVFYIVFAIIFLALLTTFSRSSYLMFLVSGLTLSILKKSKTIFIATLILFAILLSGFQLYINSIAQPRNINRERSASFRANTWQQGLELFQKSPVLGVGFNAYRYAVDQYNIGDKQFLQSHGSSSNDSSLLFVLSTTGILGLAAYIYFLWTLAKTPSKNKSLLIAGLAGLSIHSVFANSLFYPPILAWILLISITSKK